MENDQNDKGVDSQKLPKWLVLLILVVLGARVSLEFAFHNQPIFEGYIGRQIPTAMVARDLLRGGSFILPKLQTGPFPSYFLVEPPVYALATVETHEWTGLALEACGRLVSLFGLGFGALGVWLRVNQSSGKMWGWVAAIIFISFPVSMKFGRAFQPDSFALGITFLGVVLASCQRSFEIKILSWFLITLGIATKITLFPLLILLPLPNHDKKLNTSDWFGILVARCVFLVPALAWYVWVIFLNVVSVGSSTGQSADGFQAWWGMIGPLGLFEPSAMREVLLNLLFRAYSPIVFIIVACCFIDIKIRNEIKVYLFMLLVWLMVVGAKAHHAYYWLVPAPAIAVITTVGLMQLQSLRLVKPLIVLIICAMGLIQSRTTWQTPCEWLPLVYIPDEIRVNFSKAPRSVVVSLEAAIYAVDQPGFRWEFPPDAQKRAAEVFGFKLTSTSPLELLNFYRRQGAKWFLAIETDPYWPQLEPLLNQELSIDAVVAKGNGLILYRLNP